jgi:hypothetical protein
MALVRSQGHYPVAMASSCSDFVSARGDQGYHDDFFGAPRYYDGFFSLSRSVVVATTANRRFSTWEYYYLIVELS